MSRSTKRNAVIAGLVALAVLLGVGAWTVASRSNAAADLAGASSTGNFGSVVTVRNDGGYILRVTNERTGGVWMLPSCTQDTQWPRDPNSAWNPDTNPVNIVKASPTDCERTWREATAGQNVDVKLLIQACIGGIIPPARGTTAITEGCKSGKTEPTLGGTWSGPYGLRELPITTSSSGGVCDRLTCSAPHYIASGARVILNRVGGGISETWKFNPVGDEGLQANVTNLGNGWSRGNATKAPWQYRIDGFSDPKRPIGSRITVVNRTGGIIYVCDRFNRANQTCTWAASPAYTAARAVNPCSDGAPASECQVTYDRKGSDSDLATVLMDAYLQVDRLGLDSNRETCLLTTTGISRWTASMLLSDFEEPCRQTETWSSDPAKKSPNGWGISRPYPGQTWTWTRDRSKEAPRRASDPVDTSQDVYQWTYLGRNTTDGYAEYTVVVS